MQIVLVYLQRLWVLSLWDSCHHPQTVVLNGISFVGLYTLQQNVFLETMFHRWQVDRRMQILCTIKYSPSVDNIWNMMGIFFLKKKQKHCNSEKGQWKSSNKLLTCTISITKRFQSPKWLLVAKRVWKVGKSSNKVSKLASPISCMMN